MSRVLAVWCPDWPVVAAAVEAGLPARLPSVVLRANLVTACNAPARAFGIHRGMRRRDAQGRCPEVQTYPDDPDRDARGFEPVLAAVEELRPGVTPLRPGLLALPAPGRFHGGEVPGAALVAERLVTAGVWDVRLGVADEPWTAEQAARQAEPQDALVVEPGGSAAFLRGLPVEALATALPEGGADVVGLLRRLGLRSLGDLAGLPHGDVRARFGAEVAWVHRLLDGACGAGGLLAPRTPPPELAVHVDFEPPLDSAETICFSSRRTADAFVAGLARHRLVCTEVLIEARSEGADPDGPPASSRRWLHPRFLTAADLVDRLHWQLQGGWRTGRGGGDVGAPVDRVRFEPLTVVPEAVHAEGFWGGTEERVARGIARVQGMVGHEAVLSPVLQGGRAPADRQRLVPWGERPTDLRPTGPPWPGSIPPPAPTRVLTEPWPARVEGEGGAVVAVDDRGAVTAPPARFCARPGARLEPVAAWAGPWPVEELWWEAAPGVVPRRVARFQVVGVDGRAWLLTWEAGPGAGTWWTEAVYD